MRGAKVADQSRTLPEPDWEADAAQHGRTEFPCGITVEPVTPLIGADVTGIDPTARLDDAQLDALSAALLRYKVLMIRSGGRWLMDVGEHTRLCQQLSGHWGIRADTPQKRLNASEGLTVHPFLPWRRGHRHIWPTGSVTGGGQQYRLRDSEDIENFEPFAAQKDRGAAPKPARRDAGRRRSAFRPGSFGSAALAQDSVNNGANAFHFDDGFFHQPPSAVVLNALVLPRVGGDTLFADMGAAFRGLHRALQERAISLTQTMDWRHTFPIWEAEAARRDAGDPFALHVEQLIHDYPPSTQPLIRKHPVTGELSIYSNLGFTRHINDVSAHESRELMGILSRMAERPEYQVRLRWRDVGDVCIYDNRITNHYAVADYGKVGPRALHHVALLGEPTEDADGRVIG